MSKKDDGRKDPYDLDEEAELTDEELAYFKEKLMAQFLTQFLTTR